MTSKRSTRFDAQSVTIAPESDRQRRLRIARLSLDGLSLGDAFGERFFGIERHGGFDTVIADRALPAGPWAWTDDTAMAGCIVETLAAHGHVNQDDLAKRFASCYVAEPDRGYGAGARAALHAIHEGASWREAAGALFDGQGSMGNGGAMRAGPIGAFFADDLDVAAEEARLSAQVTHAHPEGQAGAIAVAVAAAQTVQVHSNRASRFGRYAIEAAIEYTPEGATRAGLIRALRLPFHVDIATAVVALGNGSAVIAADTVPLALWCAARHTDRFEDAMWTTVSARGDRDTTCAIVGSLVALAVGQARLPDEWITRRERLPH
ncbi:MAG: ADP-ribosylglycohydrolase family protein [Phycisphaera sp.]|nr:ADP-ribosylglycohydrolase family protein [Phycisphaera sp.]